jgi:hypothetical protein
VRRFEISRLSFRKKNQGLVSIEQLEARICVSGDEAHPAGDNADGLAHEPEFVSDKPSIPTDVPFDFVGEHDRIKTRITRVVRNNNDGPLSRDVLESRGFNPVVATNDFEREVGQQLVGEFFLADQTTGDPFSKV